MRRSEIVELIDDLQSLASRLEDAINGDGRLVSYGPLPGEGSAYFLRIETEDSYEVFTPDRILENIAAFAAWLKTLPRTAPNEGW